MVLYLKLRLNSRYANPKRTVIVHKYDTIDLQEEYRGINVHSPMEIIEN